jgi:hypothetical protein
MIKITRAEQLARLVLMFHQGGEWCAAHQEVWREITGNDEVTTRALCDFARKVLREEESRPV